MFRFGAHVLTDGGREGIVKVRERGRETERRACMRGSDDWGDEAHTDGDPSSTEVGPGGASPTLGRRGPGSFFFVLSFSLFVPLGRETDTTERGLLVGDTH
jgi:hypothetical protein